ncbi:hypothetical protein NKH16_34535, partial [Mesorhizobium sp. M1307]|uniref:hypothetical protein n=1 Tax=unclassified Mesorhizobium TaxID=325217 RepID=UPI00333B9C47
SFRPQTPILVSVYRGLPQEETSFAVPADAKSSGSRQKELAERKLVMAMEPAPAGGLLTRAMARRQVGLRRVKTTRL